LISAIVGDEFFDDEPLYPVKWLFSALGKIHEKQARAKELLVSKGYIDYVAKAEEVEGLGYVDATKRKFPSLPSNILRLTGFTTHSDYNLGQV
jgi:hypothetical protein